MAVRFHVAGTSSVTKTPVTDVAASVDVDGRVRRYGGSTNTFYRRGLEKVVKTGNLRVDHCFRSTNKGELRRPRGWQRHDCGTHSILLADGARRT